MVKMGSRMPRITSKWDVYTGTGYIVKDAVEWEWHWHTGN